MSDDPTRAVSDMLAGIFGHIDTALEEEGIPLTADQRAFLVRAADRSMTP